MNTRLVTSALCAGALVIACRSHARNEAASAPAKVSHHTDASGKLSTSVAARPQGKNVKLALRISNTTAKRLELSFPNGQSYDFVVVDSSGNEIWRWGKGRMFTRTLRNKYIERGESLEIAERWNNVPGPGRYAVIATLTSSNYPVSERIEFTVQ